MAKLRPGSSRSPLEACGLRLVACPGPDNTLDACGLQLYLRAVALPVLLDAIQLKEQGLPLVGTAVLYFKCYLFHSTSINLAFL